MTRGFTERQVLSCCRDSLFVGFICMCDRINAVPPKPEALNLYKCQRGAAGFGGSIYFKGKSMQ